MDNMFPLNLTQLLAYLAIGGLVGAVIGASRKNFLFGFVVGFLLGPIGWVIAAFVDRRKQCPACKGRIADGATKCLHCGSTIAVEQAPAEPPVAPESPPKKEFTIDDYEKWKSEKGIQ
jgi:hypothetical protein